MTPNWDNVLLLQTSFLGDTVLTLPLVEELRRRFPVKKLTLLCQPAVRELLQDHPAIDEIIVDDKKKTDRGVSGLRAKAHALGTRGFTLALTTHKSIRSALILYWAKIPYRIGFRQSKGWFLFHARVDRDPSRHDVERNLSLLTVFGVKVEDCRRELEFPVSAAVQESLDGKLRDLGVVEGELLVGINPGSVWPTKRWSTQGFAELILLLKKSLSCQVLLFGAPEDACVVNEVQKRCGRAAIELVNRVMLRELPAAISRCAVFITNDSAPMHIAVARRIPTVAIFCATTPGLGFYPYTNKAIVLGKDLACRPCGSHGGRRCPLGHADCIKQVGAERVLDAVQKLLGSRAATAGMAQTFQPEFVTI